MTKAEFISLIAPYAIKDMQKNGVLASVTIAQGILESGYGNTELALNANNFFGMKCNLSGNTWAGSTWTGESYTKQTKEQDAAGNEYTVTADFRKYPSIAESVGDHSAYLLGATNGTKKRYEGLKGCLDARQAITIIKNGGYATDVAYIDKIMRIINESNLTQYDNQAMQPVSLKVVDKIMFNSPAYTAGVNIPVKGMYLHSIGCPCENGLNIIEYENQASANAAVQAVVQRDGTVYNMLPMYADTKTACRNWHAGKGTKGSANDTHVGVEMCEPATIKYTAGAEWVEIGDGTNTKAHVLGTYKTAVAYFAKRCQEFGLNPLADGVILSHSEGHKRGYASNHADVEHLWSKYGLTMNQFRADVAATMQGQPISITGTVTITDTSNQAINTLNGTVTVVYAGADGLNVRTSPAILPENVASQATKGDRFTVTGISADEKWYRIKRDGIYYISAVPGYVEFKATEEQKASTAGTGYYRVRKAWDDAASQIGAFKAKENAIALCAANTGYKVYSNDGGQVYPQITRKTTPYTAKVSIDDLRIRKGPGTTYDYQKENGAELHTGKGSFTIIEEAEGPGAQLWGLLKSYQKERNGWISLDYTKR